MTPAYLVSPSASGTSSVAFTAIDIEDVAGDE